MPSFFSSVRSLGRPRIELVLVLCQRSQWLIVAASLMLSACTSLPDINYLKTNVTTPVVPTVIGKQGMLSAKRSQTLLARRLQHVGHDKVALAALEEAITGQPLIAGNQVQLLFDGPQTMEAMMAAIRDARDHINLETYIFDQDELSLKFANLLMEKQQAGVPVHIICDSIGTLGTPEEFFEAMRAAGIRMVEFNPVNPLKKMGVSLGRLNNRDHRKILVVDGRVGFTGGVNIAGDYANSSLFRSQEEANAELGWRDTHLHIEGPAVASLQWLFLDAWVRQGGELRARPVYFPPLPEVGNKLVRVLATEPGEDYAVYKAYILAMQEARKSIHVTVAYFAPDAQMIDVLIAAAHQGIDVQMIFPSVSDAGAVFHAGRSFYEVLLQSGIRIFEFQHSVLHAKTAVIDGVWSTVGSANLDMRSFLHNTEVNVIVVDKEFGDHMEDAFAEDLRHSREVRLDEWEKRPVGDRFKEWLARNFSYWL